MSDTVLETARCVVRRWRDAHLADLMAVYGDADAMKWVGDGQPITEAECRQWLDVTRRNYAQRGYGMFAVELGDEFVRMALGQKARVEVVHTMPPGEPVLGNGGNPARAEAATKLDELGGVAVVLRYTDLPTG